MEFKFTREWSLKAGNRELDFNVSPMAGRYDSSADECISPQFLFETKIVFSKFVSLCRRNLQLSREGLAKEALIDLADVVEIEDDPNYKPDFRVVYQLAELFKIDPDTLTQIAGLRTSRDSRLGEEMIKFAARSNVDAKLSPQEKAAFEAFVSFLSERK